MNVAAHSAPTLGVLIMAFGMVVIMCVPFYLRSSLNRTIAIPRPERKHRLSVAYVIVLGLGILLITTTVLDVGRIYRLPSLGLFGAVVLYILLEMLAGSKSRGTGE